ncbi:MAG TPA: hydroxymethylbilane synthase [Terriglobia bacterium]|nr:hydroxymethylbilane synthase [Terriglobia bacterium]
MKIIVGTRGSALALWQANWARDQLVILRHAAEIKVIRTSGDQPERPGPVPATAASVAGGGKGLFIKELEEALLAGSIDVAVHSLKDLPLDQPAGLTIAAISARQEARDVLVCREGALPKDAGGFDALPAGARVATGSLRRQAQLRHLRPDLRYVPIRGNVDTRLRKLDAGECEALVLAAAGLIRLGLEARIGETFSPDRLCPAPGQGALGIETRADATAGESSVEVAASALNDPDTRHAVRAERAVIWHLGGDCSTPVGAYAEASAGHLSLTAIVASPDGSRVIRADASGFITHPEELGSQVAEDLLRQGARQILGNVPDEQASASL